MAAAKHGAYRAHDILTNAVRGGLDFQENRAYAEKEIRERVSSYFSTRRRDPSGGSVGKVVVGAFSRSEAVQDVAAQLKVSYAKDFYSLPEKRKISPSNLDRNDDKLSDVTITSSCDLEDGQLVEEEEDAHLPSKNISSSRWADKDDDLECVDDEGITGHRVIKRRKVSSASVSTASLSNRSTSTTESDGVITTQDSEGSSSRMSLSAGEDSDLDASYYQSDSDTGSDDDMIRTVASDQPSRRSINMLQGCRNVDEFEKLNKINEGTYGVVFRARDKKTGDIVALKKVKMEREREGFPLTALREINILLSFNHPHIVDVKEVVVGNSLDSIFMVMEYMDYDLKGVMETMKQPFSQSEVKCLMLQLLKGVNSLHDNWVLHRDLKTSNLLLNNNGELKICDFGMARNYGSPLKPYTQLVVTLWYRAPELLLGAKEYSTAVDMWSVGCIMAELLAKEPLFNGKTELDQLDKIYKILGTPNEKMWPGFSKFCHAKFKSSRQCFNKLREKFPAASFSGRPTLSEKGFDLLNRLLTYDPEKRITAEAALKHEWFTEVPLPRSKEFNSKFPSENAQSRLSERSRLQQWGIGTSSVFG